MASPSTPGVLRRVGDAPDGSAAIPPGFRPAPARLAQRRGVELPELPQQQQLCSRRHASRRASDGGGASTRDGTDPSPAIVMDPSPRHSQTP